MTDEIQKKLMLAKTQKSKSSSCFISGRWVPACVPAGFLAALTRLIGITWRLVVADVAVDFCFGWYVMGNDTGCADGWHTPRF